MKYNYWVCLLLISTLFSGCVKRELDSPLQKTSVNMSSFPKVTLYEGAKTLSFTSEKELKDWFISLAPLSASEQREKVDRLGVETFYSAYNNLMLDLEYKLSSEGEEFLKSKGFIDWRDKVGFYGVFTSTQSEVYPQFRGVSLAESNTANKNGIYLVNGKPIKLEVYKDYKDYLSGEKIHYKSYDISLENELRANNAFTKTRNRKARLEIHLDKVNFALQLRFSAQKKNGFIVKWWDRNTTTFGSKIWISELSHPFEIYEAKAPYWRIFRYIDGALKEEDAPFVLSPISDGEDQHSLFVGTYELKEEILPFGRFLLTSDEDISYYTNSCVMKGRMEVWTRGIPQHSSGKDEIDVNISL